MSNHFNTYLRLKPSHQSQETSFYKINSQTDFQLLVPPNNREPYQFTDIFYETYSTISEKLAKITTDALVSGKNSSIFVFGGPKSGKTFTLYGDSAHRNSKNSVSFHIVSNLLDYLKKVVKEKTCSITINFIEIYNEKIRDLGLAFYRKDELRVNQIADIIRNQDLEIKEAAGKAYVQDVSIIQIASVSDLIDTLVLGFKVRDFLRSTGHVVLCINLSTRVKLEVQSAKVYLVDYSESLSEQSSLDLQKILNKLYMCSINMQIKNIPFRSNKISHLLQPALLNNLISLICTIDTDPGKFKDTQESLNFIKAIVDIDKKVKRNYMINTKGLNTSQHAIKLQEEVIELGVTIKKTEDLYEEKLKKFSSLLGIDENLELLVSGEKGSREYEYCKKFREGVQTVENLILRNEEMEKKYEKIKKCLTEIQAQQNENLAKNKKHMKDLKDAIESIKNKLVEFEEGREEDMDEKMTMKTEVLEKELFSSQYLLEEKSESIQEFIKTLENNSNDIKNMIYLKELGKIELENEFKRQISDNDYANKQNLKSLEDHFLLNLSEKEKKIMNEGTKSRQEIREIEEKISCLKGESIRLFEISRLQGKSIYEIEKGKYNQGISPVVIPLSHIPQILTETRFPMIFQCLSSNILERARLSLKEKALSKSQSSFSKSRITVSSLNSTRKAKEKPINININIIKNTEEIFIDTPVNLTSLSEVWKTGKNLQRLILKNAEKIEAVSRNTKIIEETVENKKKELKKAIEEKNGIKADYQSIFKKQLDKIGNFSEKSSKLFSSGYFVNSFGLSESSTVKGSFSSLSSARNNKSNLFYGLRPYTSDFQVFGKK